MKIINANLPALLSPNASGPGQVSAGKRDEPLFQKILNEVNKLQDQADNNIHQSILGRADLHETMLSLEKASLGLKMLLQVRNKMIQTYEELSRMNM